MAIVIKVYTPNYSGAESQSATCCRGTNVLSGFWLVTRGGSNTSLSATRLCFPQGQLCTGTSTDSCLFSSAQLSANTAAQSHVSSVHVLRLPVYFSHSVHVNKEFALVLCAFSRIAGSTFQSQPHRQKPTFFVIYSLEAFEVWTLSLCCFVVKDAE